MAERKGISKKLRFEVLVDTEEDYETVSDMAKSARNWTEFWELINEYYEGDW